MAIWQPFQLEAEQLHAVPGLFAAMCVRFVLTEEDVWFHRDFTNTKSCPGTRLDRHAFRVGVAAGTRSAGAGVAGEGLGGGEAACVGCQDRRPGRA